MASLYGRNSLYADAAAASTTSEVSNPPELCHPFKEVLSEDYLRRSQRDATSPSHESLHLLAAQLWALRDIDRHLRSAEQSLASFPSLPQLPDAFSQEDTQTLVPTRSLPQMFAIAEVDVPRLDPGQRQAFDTIVAALRNPGAHRTMFFLDGPAGTGKSFLYNTLIAYTCAHLRLRPLAVASSGIAALLLHGGRTAHSAFKIPLQTTEGTVFTIFKQSRLAREL